MTVRELRLRLTHEEYVYWVAYIMEEQEADKKARRKAG